MIRKTTTNDYGYSIGLPCFMMFKDPKGFMQIEDFEAYQKAVLDQVREDILRLHGNFIVIKKQEIPEYLKKGYTIMGIKMHDLNENMYPSFFKITRNGVRRKPCNQRIVRGKSSPEEMNYLIAYQKNN